VNLSAALKKNKTVKSINLGILFAIFIQNFLASNFLRNEGAIDLASTIKMNSSLNFVNLREKHLKKSLMSVGRNSIGDSGAIELFNGISTNTSIQNLNLCNSIHSLICLALNSISNRGIEVMTEKLILNQNLKVLNLSKARHES
jgi:hypothetical protein